MITVQRSGAVVSRGGEGKGRLVVDSIRCDSFPWPNVVGATSMDVAILWSRLEAGCSYECGGFLWPNVVVGGSDGRWMR